MIRYYDLDRWIGAALARSPLNRSVCEPRSALLTSGQFNSENSAATPMREKWDRCDWFADARPSVLHAPRRTYTRTQQPAIVPLVPRRVSSTSRKSRITVDLQCHRFRAYLLTSSQYRQFPPPPYLCLFFGSYFATQSRADLNIYWISISCHEARPNNVRNRVNSNRWRLIHSRTRVKECDVT